MNQRAAIIEELKALESPLATFPAQSPFAVPDGYFDGLAEGLTADVLLSEMEEPTMPDLPRSLPYSIPDFYFEKLPEDLTQAAAAVDFTQVKTPAFSTPEGYFETLPARLLAVAKNENAAASGAKLIAFRPAWKQWTVAAAAAVFLLSLSLGSYRYFAMHTPDAIVAKQLSQIDPENISGYVEQHLDEFDETALVGLAASAQPVEELSLPALNTDDIQQYIEENGDLPLPEKATTL